MLTVWTRITIATVIVSIALIATTRRIDIAT